MLVLTRLRGESITIGADIVIKVLDIHRGEVRLAIHAPHGTGVHRAEIAERIRAGGGDPSVNVEGRRP